MGSNMDYWRCFRIKMSHGDMYKKSFYPEALDKFNVYDNLFLLLTMSALECFKLWAMTFLEICNASFNWLALFEELFLL